MLLNTVDGKMFRLIDNLTEPTKPIKQIVKSVNGHFIYSPNLMQSQNDLNLKIIQKKGYIM